MGLVHVLFNVIWMVVTALVFRCLEIRPWAFIRQHLRRYRSAEERRAYKAEREVSYVGGGRLDRARQ